MSDANNNARLMTPFEHAASTAKHTLLRFRRRYLPYLVWHDSQVDVTITFSEHVLDSDDPMRSLFSSRVGEITRAIYGLGVDFDRGVGFDGYDWEWDYSLKGPISVAFRGVTKDPSKRKSKPKPRLVVNNAENAA